MGLALFLSQFNELGSRDDASFIVLEGEHDALRDTQCVPRGDREGKGSQRTQCEKWLCVTWVLYTNDTNIAAAGLMLSGAVVCWLLSKQGLQQRQPGTGTSAGGSRVVPAGTSASSPLHGAEQAQDTQQPEEPAGPTS